MSIEAHVTRGSFNGRHRRSDRSIVFHIGYGLFAVCNWNAGPLSHLNWPRGSKRINDLLLGILFYFIMSRRNRPSSLPSSLIPHLYTGPQRDSFARTTLPDNDADDDAEPLHLRPLEEDFYEHSPHPVDHTLQRYHLYDQPYSRYSEPGPSTRREIYLPDPERHELPHRPYHAQDYNQGAPFYSPSFFFFSSDAPSWSIFFQRQATS